MRCLILVVLAASAALTSPGGAFDAGGFAFQQHQHQLLQQQTAPTNDAWHPQKQSDETSQVQARKARSMKQLRAEYERRVKRDGLTAANQWLSREAYRLGQMAAEMQSQ
jgi:hypothetical protein